LNTLEQLRAGELAGAQRISLSCGLKFFPPEIYALADTLEVLDLSGNLLSSLPHDLARLHKLRTVFCSRNLFTELPTVLGQCAGVQTIGFRANQIRSFAPEALPQGLRSLVLTDNQLSDLPASIGRCTNLQKLMLTGNQLRDLPAELAACTRLELLRIANNRMTTLPRVVFSLPRLAWLAFAANPVSDAAQTARASAKATDIAWNTLHLQQQLGEGASGVIYQARWRAPQGQTDQLVAVKIFKGSLSSDGLPGSEIAACIGAGDHPNLITVHGTLTGHPDGASGVVMALVDARFQNLAGPPSLDSCTRDVYSAGARFGVDTVLRIAHGVASAAGHLHACGILHGDLYAHNILHSGEGTALLGDLGAASFFDTGNAAQARALQSLDIRAFSCLLSELMARCDASANATPALLALTALQADCAKGTAAKGPSFADIEQQLVALA